MHIISRGAAVLAALSLACGAGRGVAPTDHQATADLVVYNARITTLDDAQPDATAIAVAGGRILRVGDDAAIRALTGRATRVIDARGRRLIPGLIDSHAHYIRGGLMFNAELRWDGVPTLADGLERIRRQAARTPAGQWVRVIGGWSPWQFAERRLPTPRRARRRVPRPAGLRAVFLQLGARQHRGAARARLRPRHRGAARDAPRAGCGRSADRRVARRSASGIDVPDTGSPPAAGTSRSAQLDGAALPHPGPLRADRRGRRRRRRSRVSRRLPGREPARRRARAAAALGVQPVSPASRSGARRLPALDGRVPRRPELRRRRGSARAARCRRVPAVGRGRLRELPVAATGASRRVRDALRAVVREMVQRRWPFSIHATYDETISMLLDVIEEVDHETPLAGLRFSIDHAETISDRNIERIRTLGGGLAVQSRMVMLGDDFVARYGAEAARRTPPVRRMLDLGVPIGLGSDAPRGSTFNPFVTLHWLITGRTASGRELYLPADRLTRLEALRLHTVGSAWFSGEEDRKGRLRVGYYADFALLDADYFSVPESEIPRIESVLTVVGGDVVHAAGELGALAPPRLEPSPAWSPVAYFEPYATGALSGR